MLRAASRCSVLKVAYGTTSYYELHSTETAYGATALEKLQREPAGQEERDDVEGGGREGGARRRKGGGERGLR